MDVSYSVNGVPIRLTKERWAHIVENKPYMSKKEILEKSSMAHLLKAVSHLVQLPKTHMWLDYDEGADVLYVHFEDRPRSTHSDMRDDGAILDYNGRWLVGATILEASHR